MLTIPRPRRLAVAAVAAVGAMCVSVLPAAATQGAPPSKALRAGPTAHAPRQAQAAASAAVGATTPFSVYEAEEGTPGGGAAVRSLTSAPTTQYSSAALEASGHSYVHLGGTGQSVQWTNNTGQPISFLNVRASIADSASGGGVTGTLNLYVNGVFRQELNLNSRQSWVYEGNGNYNTSDNQNPADGDPRVFWDESHTFVTGSPIPAGATFSLRKDSDSSASFYDVDSVDVENPPAPLTQLANSISITSCGAVADNNPTNGAADSQSVDSRAAIQTCIDQAQSQGKTLWIPQGTFYVKGTAGLNAQRITIAGAGMWYSTIYRDVPVPNSTPLAALFDLTSCTVRNFHIDANAVSRSTIGGDGGAMDTTGTGWLADGIWTQHTMSGFWASGTGGTVQNSRLTSIWADGINVNNVSLGADTGNNLTVTNNFVRGTGDDAIAINSVHYNTNSDGSQTFYNPMTNVTVSDNTSIAPWGGKGVGIYGGSGHQVRNNYISDTARYIGLGAGRFGVNGSDLLSATVTGNTVVRSGGNAYSQGQPALHIGNGGDGQNTGIVDKVTVTGNTVTDSLYDGIGFSTSTNTLLQDNTVSSPGRNGIAISPSFYPAPTGSATITGNTVTGLGSGTSAFVNNSTGFVATLSDNHWPPAAPEGPYGGTPAAVPGTVQAENYDTGGQGVAYNVTSVNGNANSYRADGVDLDNTADTGGGYNLGWTGGGQWFRYTVDVATAGTYTLGLRVAAPSAVAGALHLSDASGTDLTGAVDLPATGDWQTWATVTTHVVLPAGRQILTLNQDTGGWNINHLAFAAGSGSPQATLTASPGSLTFADQAVNTTSAAQTVTVTNSGTATASITGVTAGGDFTQTSTCGTSLAAGANCTVSVTFRPTASGTHTGTLTLTGNQSNNPTTVALSGTGTDITGTNLAAGKPTSESSHTDVYPSSNVTDSDQGSYWESANNTFPQWVQVDLGSARSASRVVLQLPATWGARSQTLTLSGSTDGTTFTTLKSSAVYTFDPNTKNTVTLTFPAATQRYFRVTITANNGWPAGQVSEFQIWAS
ncbi:discoidin domain-containing protein [Streptomyces mirabilis]|uniref:discoidin domain-containing protein n=1 Tax=Streptomyces mirabilis TaxID=68239 RepID=UPI0021BEE5BC|nr:discoidin domain-containing protein [Streptomyces mirabilis]MCT9112109.1 discoidin domain-containing protein [Streptomyces mirabilis]